MHTVINKTLCWSYRVILSLSVAVAGICLAAQCLLLYRSGEQPYSPESVAAYFSEIAVPIYFCGIMILLGVVLKPLFPYSKVATEKNFAFILERMRQTTDLSLCPQPMQADIKRLRRNRQCVRIIGLLLLGVCTAVFLIYGANPNNFGSEINASVTKAVFRLIPAMAVPFAFGIFDLYQGRHSMQKEIVLLKSAPAEAKITPSKKEEAQGSVLALRMSILAVALFLIILGYFMGGTVDVLTKAVNICTECIGLG